MVDVVDLHTQWASFTEIAEIRENLQKLQKVEATKSSVEYYRSQKGLSYPIENDTRGRSLVFTMTNNRSGWKEDVKALQEIFAAVDIEATFEFDLERKEIRRKLQEFTESEKNDKVDCAFVIFMAHGYGQGTNTFLQARDCFFEIWSNVSSVFAMRSCKLHRKPKLILKQICRDHSDSEPAVIETSRPIDHYICVLSSQPGQTSKRDSSGSIFIQKISEFMKRHCHNTHMMDLLQTMSRQFDASTCQTQVQQDAALCQQGANEETFLDMPQKPQIVYSLDYAVNLFPGITSGIVAQHRPNHEKDPEEGPRDSCAESQPMTENSSQRPVDKKVSVGLKTTASVKPPSSREHVEQAIAKRLQDENEVVFFSKELSKQIGTKLDVTIVQKGCIYVEIEISDGREIENVRYHAETGVLSIIFESTLVTKELLDTSNASSINLTVDLDMETYKAAKTQMYDAKQYLFPIHRKLADQFFTSGDEAIIRIKKCEGEISWKKNGQDITSDSESRIHVKNHQNESILKIVNISQYDEGVYECGCSGNPTEYATITKLSLFVIGSKKTDIVRQQLVEIYQMLIGGAEQLAKNVDDKEDKAHILKDAQDLSNHVEVLRNKERERFFTGRTSVGKSTFINAFLGAKLLPSLHGATTAHVIKVKGEDRKNIQLSARVDDKEQMQVSQYKSASDVHTYLRKNKKKLVGQVELILPLETFPMLKNSIVLYDSPGIGHCTSFNKAVYDVSGFMRTIVLICDVKNGFTQEDKSTYTNLCSDISPPVSFIVMNQEDINEKYTEEDEKRYAQEEADEQRRECINFLIHVAKVTKEEAEMNVFFLSGERALEKKASYKQKFDDFFNVLYQQETESFLMKKLPKEKQIITTVVSSLRDISDGQKKRNKQRKTEEIQKIRERNEELTVDQFENQFKDKLDNMLSLKRDEYCAPDYWETRFPGTGTWVVSDVQRLTRKFKKNVEDEIDQISKDVINKYIKSLFNKSTLNEADSEKVVIQTHEAFKVCENGLSALQNIAINNSDIEVEFEKALHRIEDKMKIEQKIHEVEDQKRKAEKQRIKAEQKAAKINKEAQQRIQQTLITAEKRIDEERQMTKLEIKKAKDEAELKVKEERGKMKRQMDALKMIKDKARRMIKKKRGFWARFFGGDGASPEEVNEIIEQIEREILTGTEPENLQDKMQQLIESDEYLQKFLSTISNVLGYFPRYTSAAPITTQKVHHEESVDSTTLKYKRSGFFQSSTSKQIPVYALTDADKYEDAAQLRINTEINYTSDSEEEFFEAISPFDSGFINLTSMEEAAGASQEIGFCAEKSKKLRGRTPEFVEEMKRELSQLLFEQYQRKVQSISGLTFRIAKEVWPNIHRELHEISKEVADLEIRQIEIMYDELSKPFHEFDEQVARILVMKRDLQGSN